MRNKLIMAGVAAVLVALIVIQGRLIVVWKDVAAERADERDQARAELDLMAAQLQRSRDAVVAQQERLETEQERYTYVQKQLQRFNAEDSETSHWSGQRLPGSVTAGRLQL